MTAHTPSQGFSTPFLNMASTYMYRYASHKYAYTQCAGFQGVIKALTRIPTHTACGLLATPPKPLTGVCWMGHAAFLQVHMLACAACLLLTAACLHVLHACMCCRPPSQLVRRGAPRGAASGRKHPEARPAAGAGTLCGSVHLQRQGVARGTGGLRAVATSMGASERAGNPSA